MSCAKAAEKIYKLADRKKGAMYIVGAKYRALYFFSALVPKGSMLTATANLMIKRK